MLSFFRVLLRMRGTCRPTLLIKEDFLRPFMVSSSNFASYSDNSTSRRNMSAEIATESTMSTDKDPTLPRDPSKVKFEKISAEIGKESNPKSIKRQPSTSLNEKITLDRRAVYELLKHNVDELRFYYTSIETKSTYGPRFAEACTTIWHSVTEGLPILEYMASIAYQYDFAPEVPGNGLRSIVSVVDACVLHLLRILKEIQEQRSSLLFRGNHYVKEMEAFAGAFVILVKAVQRVHQYLNLWPPNELFAAEEVDRKLRTLMAEIESLDQSPFYGRTMGFQFCASLLQVFQVIGISLASYSLLWDEKRPASTSITGAASNLFTSGQYVINPEERAKRIFQVTLNADIAFCKAFWNLTEGPLLQELPRWFSPNLAVNEMWQIPGDLALTLETIDGRDLEVPPPSAYSGTKNLPIRVLSFHCREGMPAPNVSRVFKSQATAGAVLPKSPTLVLHVHGGGFVATSSKTHEPYLRHWAKSLNCPIVSVDYSLAPEHPYPRAAEEIYYAYAWVLANADKLGWTGERICLAGDSAGGLLLASTTLRLIKRHIRRLPDGLVLIYPALLAQYSPSPSRLLSLLDPLLPMGIITRCLAAYTGNIDYLKNDTATAESTSSQEDPSAATESVKSAAPSKKQLTREQGASTNRKPDTSTSQGDQEILNFVKRARQDQPRQKSNSGVEIGMDVAAAESMDTSDPNATQRPGFVLSTSSEEDERSQELENAKTEQQAESFREFFHRQLSRTSGGRTRSQSENFPRSSQSEDRGSQSPSSSSSSEDLDSDQLLARIAQDVPRDPKLIVFTVANHEESFLDYLRDQEVTKQSFRRLTTPAHVPKKSCERDAKKSEQEPMAAAPTENELERSGSTSDGRQGSHVRSQSAGSLASLTRASATIGQKMGMYVMDSLTGWFNAGATFDVRSMFNNDGMATPSGRRQAMVENGKLDSPLAKFHDMPVPKDPFLSPLLAPDPWLARFPKTAILACHLDPLLDDSVSFAKRLKNAGADVSLDLVDSLPHGFLNFAMFSPECREAARICVQRMREILQITPNRERSSTAA